MIENLKYKVRLLQVPPGNAGHLLTAARDRESGLVRWYCPSVCLLVCLLAWRQHETAASRIDDVHLFVRLSVCLSVCLSICRQNAKNAIFSKQQSNLEL